MERLLLAQVEREPFAYLIVPGFLSASSLARINATYPAISKGGSYPVDMLDDGMVIKQVLAELDRPEFEAVIAEKFGMALRGHPKMFSLRGYLRAKDGEMHTDSRDKLITVLLYLNEAWPHAGGRLRLLRNGHNLDDFAAEVEPAHGNLLVFKRSENSWHGHHPFEGPRRALQMNWMVDEHRRGFHALRHKVSAALKRLNVL
jgi:hypothetical protein